MIIRCTIKVYLQFVLECRTDLDSGNMQTCNIIKELWWKISVRISACVENVDPLYLQKKWLFKFDG